MSISESIRDTFRRVRAHRRRGVLENADIVPQRVFDVETGLPIFFSNNQRFVDRMHDEHRKHKKRITVGIVPRQNLVIGLWQNEKGETQASAFVVSNRLPCANNAFFDATAYESRSSDSFFVFHSSRGYNSLKRRVKKYNREYARLLTNSDGTLDLDKARYSYDTFDYEGESMSPINYLALLAQGKITGLEVLKIPSFPPHSASVRRGRQQ